jgi:osmotically-inducible protein OsmY
MKRKVTIWLASGSLLAFAPLAAQGQATPDSAAEQRQEIRQEVQRELDDAADEAEELRQDVADEVEDAAEDAADAAEEQREHLEERAEEIADEADDADNVDWSQRIKDASTTARVETLFMVNDHLSALDINTTTRNDVVTLEGIVGDPGERELAEELARSIEDVGDVDNRLQVATRGGNVDEDNVDTATEDVADNDRDLRGRVNDANLAATVRNRIRSHDRIDGNVNVRSNEGTVLLSGQVYSEEEKDLAETLASRTRGVHDVDNEIEVLDEDGNVTRDDADGSITDVFSDEWAEKRVEQAIAFSRNLSIWDLDVEVDDKVCVLEGAVPTEEAKKLAQDIALETRGVDEVVNNLVVSDTVQDYS